MITPKRSFQKLITFASISDRSLWSCIQKLLLFLLFLFAFIKKYAIQFAPVVLCLSFSREKTTTTPIICDYLLNEYTWLSAVWLSQLLCDWEIGFRIFLWHKFFLITFNWLWCLEFYWRNLCCFSIPRSIFFVVFVVVQRKSNRNVSESFGAK